MSKVLSISVKPYEIVETMRQTIICRDLGLVTYGEGLRIQHETHGDCLSGRIRGAFLFLEHTPVLTFGKHADQGYLLVDEGSLSREGIDLVTTDRGGEITAHNPGQLVVYPIVPLRNFGLSPKTYVALLEECVIELLRHYDLDGRVDPINPGVWVGQNKICALGIRIKQRVTMHGLALNVINDLSLFQKIVPCGITGRGVTSIEREASCRPLIEEVKNRFKEIFQEKFQMVLIANKES